MAPQINYALARKVGQAALPPGPAITPAEAISLVADLRRSVGSALGYVAEITGLDEACRAAAQVPVAIVDRRGLVKANVGMAESLIEGAITDDGAGWITRNAAGAQLGGLLAVMAARVLGQFDPFANDGAGRVALVAPNVLRFERELGADPSDFHLWIALHEVTHAAQFSAAPWLRDWLRGHLAQLAQEDDPDDEAGGPFKRLLAAARKLPHLLEDKGEGSQPLEGLLSRRQAQVLAEVTATMSLLEGHADVIMDAVGPAVLRSIEQLRPKFDARRVARGRLERAVRRLAGIEAKTAQYVQGAAFVRAVLAEVGHEGLGAVWVGQQNLPTPAEMDDPSAWLARVHGA
ncbi:MAG: zinc-dependent metalloprotease [Bifidobacteriaceae bacterium]|jgi:coenzyme F420 biosynthesis associated uncharacterized protein|nr:zinc-dependent metalloprotease [Bifidobacteriaceae bacterium]